MSEAPETGQAWMSNDGSFTDIQSAPEGVKEFLEKKNYKNINDMVKSYSELESYKNVPADRFAVIPDKPDDEEGWSKFYSKIKPVSPDKYNWNYKLPEGVEITNDIKKNFAEFAHKNNFTEKQANAAIEFQANIAKMGIDLQKKAEESQKKAEELEKAEYVKQQKETIEKLKIKHNIKTDEDFKNLVAKAKKVTEDLGIYKTLESKKLSDDVEIIDAFIELSKRTSESVLPKGSSQQVVSKQDRIKAIMKDPAFTNPMSIEHDKLMEEFVALHVAG